EGGTGQGAGRVTVMPPATNVIPLYGPPAEIRPTGAVAERFERLYQRPIVLDVQKLSRRFEGEHGEVVALDEVSFRAHRPQLVCVIGPSGCGKSTLGRMIAGLDEPSGGRVMLDQHEVSGPGPDRGMVFQGYTLFPWRTVVENVAFGMEMAGRDRSTAE